MGQIINNTESSMFFFPENMNFCFSHFCNLNSLQIHFISFLVVEIVNIREYLQNLGHWSVSPQDCIKNNSDWKFLIKQTFKIYHTGSTYIHHTYKIHVNPYVCTRKTVKRVVNYFPFTGHWWSKGAEKSSSDN